MALASTEQDTILHGSQEPTEPAPWCPITFSVELIKKNEGRFLAVVVLGTQDCGGEVFDSCHLCQIDFDKSSQLAGVAVLQNSGQCAHQPRLTATRSPKDGQAEWPCRVRNSEVLLNQA